MHDRKHNEIYSPKQYILAINKAPNHKELNSSSVSGLPDKKKKEKHPSYTDIKASQYMALPLMVTAGERGC